MNAGESLVKETALTYSAEPVRVTEQMKRVAEYLKLHGEMTGDELQEFLHVKKTRAYVLAKEMRDRGIIEVTGRGPDRKYRLVEAMGLIFIESFAALTGWVVIAKALISRVLAIKPLLQNPNIGGPYDNRTLTDIAMADALLVTDMIFVSTFVTAACALPRFQQFFP